ncbi:MAG: insulinase family protein [Oscillospiraceae bacterium]|nr:insulinase family protein [Oscillospiraceae bacterium]
MKINDRLHGFAVTGCQALPELPATMWRLRHEKTGADLIWLERADENKTFAIAFKTIPENDTGIFHILEHSVLCGSRKYPVKEPFVDLLKSSLATFLNAFTFPDKTMYPLSSRNSQDFLNLMDVYLDAVFHPLSKESPLAFRQEGWHYELAEKGGPVTINGVVYNEMKGVYSSPDSVAMTEVTRLLFPDNTYGFDSGGDPSHIPELTYEMYLAGHNRFYHPSNSRIILDGDLDIDAALRKIDEFIGAYDAIDPQADIPMQKPVCREKTMEYEIGAQESTEGRNLCAGGWVYGSFDEAEKNLAMSVLLRVLAGSNTAPLKAALLNAGLCGDFDLGMENGIQQNFAYLLMKDVKTENVSAAWDLLNSTLEKLAGGLDHGSIRSALNRIEYLTREKDSGGLPLGIENAITATNSWLYGGDPALYFSYSELFGALRSKIDEGYFEALLRQVFLDNSHRCRILLTPSATLGEERSKAEAERLAAVRSGWTSQEEDRIMAEFAALRAAQEKEDTAEELATLPVLSLSDLPEKGRFPCAAVSREDGVTFLSTTVPSGGITHAALFFSLKDMKDNELAAAALLARLLGKVKTEKYSALELQERTESLLGRFSVSTQALPQKEGSCAYLTVSFSMLDGFRRDGADLVDEILNHSLLTDTEAVATLVRQTRMELEEMIMARGNMFAAMRAGSALSERAAQAEFMSGIAYLRYLQQLEGNLEAALPGLTALLSRVISRRRLTVSLTSSQPDGDYGRRLAAMAQVRPIGPDARTTLSKRASVGIVIPSRVAYNARCGALRAPYTGTAQVAGKILTFDYLWNQVRVKGGAYGCSMGVRKDGFYSYTSFREPSPSVSQAVFAAGGSALREFCRSGQKPDKYIISTIGSLEPLTTPRTEGLISAVNYLAGETEEVQQAERTQVLHTTVADLLAFSEAIEDPEGQAVTCVIGSAEQVDAIAPVIRENLR